MIDHMSPRLRKTLFYVLPGVAILGVTTVAATRPVPSGSAEASRAATDWVTAHRSSLPTQLKDIATLPFAHRRMIMAELPMEQRKQVWREHLTSFVTPDSVRTSLQRRIASGLSKPLTGDQVAFIRAEIDSLDGIFRSDITAEERAQRAGAACARTHAKFDRNDAVAIMVSVGGVDNTYFWAMSSGAPTVRFEAAGIAWTMTSAVRAAVTRLGLVPSTRMGICFCHQTDWGCDCPGGLLCVEAWPPCEPPGICGFCCGCLGMMSCDGGKCTA
jgi:hypothetical protein